MRRTKTLSVILILILLIASCAVCYAQYPPTNTSAGSNGNSNSASDPWQQIVNINAKNMPLPDVLGTLFKNSGLNYTLQTALNTLNVTLDLQNITRRDALNTLCRVIGASYRVDNGNTVTIQFDLTAATSGKVEMSPRNIPPTHPEYVKTVTEKVILNYVEPSVVVQMLLVQQGVYVLTSGSDFVVIGGTEDAIKDAKSTIRMVDTPDALSLVVRVKLTVKATVSENGKQPQTYESSTESVGAEGALMLLNIAPANWSNQQAVSLNVNLTPLVTSKAILGDSSQNKEKIISLAGSGTCSSTTSLKFIKQFDFAVSAAQNEKVVIAAGSLDSPNNGKVEFEVSATTSIESGRVRMPKWGKPKANSTQTPANPTTEKKPTNEPTH